MLIGSDLKKRQPDRGIHVRKHIIISLSHPKYPTRKVIQNDCLASSKAREMRTSEYDLSAKTTQ